MDAIEMFLIRRKQMHAHVERLTEGRSEEQIRERVHPLVNPLASTPGAPPAVASAR